MRSSATFLLTPLATGSTAPREFPIDSREVSIGSAAGNDLVIADPTVSRRHAKIVRRRRAYSVIDLESTNGTFVNGERVRGARACKSGDELRFGGARYRLKRPSAPAPKKFPSLITAMRAVMIFAVLFGAAFAVTEFQVIWNRLNEAAASRIASVVRIPPTPPSLATPSKVIALANPPPKSVAVSPAAASATVASAAPPATALREVPPAPTAAPAAAAGLPWLEALNRYRAMGGLAPVVLDPALTKAALAHAHYVAANYSDEIKAGNLGAEAHTEDPAKPYYSAAGLASARTSTVEEEWRPIGPMPTPADAIDGWVQVPFHRLWLLNPSLKRVALGQYCEARVCVTVLNVASGADLSSSVSPPLQRPVLYPPAGSSVLNGRSEGEWPSPIATCPGYAEPFGLAISLQLGRSSDSRLTGYSLTHADAAPIAACGIDADSYTNPDPAQQQRVRHSLIYFGAVVVVPRHPLAPGKYDVSITIDGKPYSWSFTIAPDPH